MSRLVRDHESVGDGENCTRCGSPASDHDYFPDITIHRVAPSYRDGVATCRVCGRRAVVTRGHSGFDYWFHLRA